ncbi:MAG: tetratricopeptide repeat protein [Kofleriaceae bacterium]
MTRALLLLALFGSVAAAQSKRYPTPPKDADKEAETRSGLWESALDPDRKPYDELVRDAKRRLDDRTRDSAQEALPKLDAAIKRLPGDYRAHMLRGHAYLLLQDWAKCTADLQAVQNPDDLDRDAIELELGICQARAGKLADAERTLVHAVTVAPHGEQWMRLGEVRIALGKLDEAEDALQAALEKNDGPLGTIHWLLALAYDRARKSTLADEQARAALSFDASFNLIMYPAYPWLGNGEQDYLIGLARMTPPSLDRDQATPEIALMHFRHFLKVAPDSPWRRRADEHVKELAATAFPQQLVRTAQSTALQEMTPIVPVIQKQMGKLRACVAKTPWSSYTVTIQKTGPLGEDRDHVRYAVPQLHFGTIQGVDVKLERSLEAITNPADDAAQKCIAQVAAGLSLPVPKDRDTYYRFSFLVVAP